LVLVGSFGIWMVTGLISIYEVQCGSGSHNPCMASHHLHLYYENTKHLVYRHKRISLETYFSSLKFILHFCHTHLLMDSGIYCVLTCILLCICCSLTLKSLSLYLSFKIASFNNTIQFNSCFNHVPLGWICYLSSVCWPHIAHLWCHLAIFYSFLSVTCPSPEGSLECGCGKCFLSISSQGQMNERKKKRMNE
jgi:hypothetical protein